MVFQLFVHSIQWCSSYQFFTRPGSKSIPPSWWRWRRQPWRTPLPPLGDEFDGLLLFYQHYWIYMGPGEFFQVYECLWHICMDKLWVHFGWCLVTVVIWIWVKIGVLLHGSNWLILSYTWPKYAKIVRFPGLKTICWGLLHGSCDGMRRLQDHWQVATDATTDTALTCRAAGPP